MYINFLNLMLFILHSKSFYRFIPRIFTIIILNHILSFQFILKIN